MFPFYVSLAQVSNAGNSYWPSRMNYMTDFSQTSFMFPLGHVLFLSQDPVQGPTWQLVVVLP